MYIKASDGNAAVMTIAGKAYKAKPGDCICPWGSVVICDSQADAVEEALAQQARWGGVDSSDEYVRLLLLQSNEELSTAIGKTETCNSKSAMYMIVDPTCKAMS